MGVMSATFKATFCEDWTASRPTTGVEFTTTADPHVEAVGLTFAEGNYVLVTTPIGATVGINGDTPKTAVASVTRVGPMGALTTIELTGLPVGTVVTAKITDSQGVPTKELVTQIAAGTGTALYSPHDVSRAAEAARIERPGVTNVSTAYVAINVADLGTWVPVVGDLVFVHGQLWEVAIWAYYPSYAKKDQVEMTVRSCGKP